MYLHDLGGGGAPYEYVVYRACKLFGCPPSMVEKERAVDVLRMLQCEAIEAEVQSKCNRSA